MWFYNSFHAEKLGEESSIHKNWEDRDFPGTSVVKTLPSNAGGTGSIPGWGTKIPRATRCDQTLKKEKGVGRIEKNRAWIW